MTEEDIAEIERVWAAAMSAPETTRCGAGTVARMLEIAESETNGIVPPHVQDAVLASPRHVAALLAEVKRMRAGIVALAARLREPGGRIGYFPTEADDVRELAAEDLRTILEGK